MHGNVCILTLHREHPLLDGSLSQSILQYFIDSKCPKTSVSGNSGAIYNFYTRLMKIHQSSPGQGNRASPSPAQTSDESEQQRLEKLHLDGVRGPTLPVGLSQQQQRHRPCQQPAFLIEYSRLRPHCGHTYCTTSKATNTK